MKLQYDPSFMYQQSGVQSGISENVKHEKKEFIVQAIAEVDTKIREKAYGFVNTVVDGGKLKAIRQLFQKIRWAKTLVVIGIGGSDLGARAIQQAVESDHPAMDVYFHGDSTDPVSLTRLLKKIDFEDTVFCVISKSGETIETISQYVLLKSFVKQQTEQWSDHFVFITDAKKGILREEADQNHVLTLDVPDDVGGRFSVLSTVGLFPALAMSVDVDQLIAGAQTAIKEYAKIAAWMATDQYLLYQQGLKVNVFMPYSVQLEEFSRWYRQLWAESLGKDGVGILPIQARGPADQHSQVQFYTQGSLLHSLLFLRIENRADDYMIEEVDVQSVSYLKGHSLHEIVNAEQKATALALKKVGRPSATLCVDSLDAFSLGELFMLFELAVVYLAKMFQIDAFNQPGVEEGKVMMYALLGRTGFEKKSQEVVDLLGR